jgi:hypothetical protein
VTIELQSARRLKEDATAPDTNLMPAIIDASRAYVTIARCATPSATSAGLA